MQTSGKVTLMASLIGSAFGTGIWFFGIAALIWPAHPHLAAFLLTLVCTIVVMQMWPDDSSPKKSQKMSS